MKPRLVQYGVFGCLLAALIVYSQTRAFHWDEGFHLLTAQLISQGKRPYLDFLFAQAPLNAFWNAFWFRLFQPTWRLAHVVAAIETWAAVALMADYLRARFPIPEWRAAAALIAASLFGLLTMTFDFGPIAQAYGFCLLMLVASFRVAIPARERPAIWRAALAGVLCGAAPSASLLTAAAVPAIFLWLWFYNAAGNRWAKSAAFAAGAIVPAIPVIRLFAAGPRQVWFDLVEYHALYRRVDWHGATAHDVDVLSGWIHDTQQFVLMILAVIGWIAFRRSNWGADTRAEFRLCLWLAVAMGAQNAVAHPTFGQYFIFLVPFAVVPACAGFYDVVTRLAYTKRPMRAVAVLGCFMLLALGRAIFESRDSDSWPGLQPVADKVNQVTPPGAPIVAPEQIYFLTRRPPPSGMEFWFAHRLNFGPQRNALLHIIPQADLENEIKAGHFVSATFCDDDDQIEKVSGWKVYSNRFDSGDCSVFWKPNAANAGPAAANPQAPRSQPR